MTSLLVVDASPRGEKAISRNMSARFVQQWKAANPDATITRRDLVETFLPYISEEWLLAYFTPPDEQTTQMKAQLAQSDELVNELIDADHLVISTPVYNYNVPANLKSWIDCIVRKGKTLGFDGCGLVKHKKATLLIASGGVYDASSPIKERDIATQYLTLILNVLGIDNVSVISGGGAKAVDMGQTTMHDFINRFEAQFEQRVTSRI